MNKFLFLLFMPSIAFSSQDTMSLDQAVKTFWVCDYVSSTTILSQGEAATCSEAFEKVKNEKFKGDFSEFMKWWNENKESEHGKLLKSK